MKRRLSNFDRDLLDCMSSITKKPPVQIQKEMAERRRNTGWRRRMRSILPASVDTFIDDLLQPSFVKVVYRLSILERTGRIARHEYWMETVYPRGTRIQETVITYRLNTPTV